MFITLMGQIIDYCKRYAKCSGNCLPLLFTWIAVMHYLSKDSTLCGCWFAWASMAVAACWMIWFFDRLVDAAA